MKINSLGYYNNLNRAGNNNITKPVALNASNSHSPVSYGLPGYNSSHTIAFSGYTINLHSWNFKNLPCPCCGEAMITSKEYFKAFGEIVLASNALEAVKVLKPFEDRMHKPERECFELIKKYAQVSPNKSVQGILIGLKKNSLKTLRASQFKIFDEIKEICNNYPGNKNKYLVSFLNQTKNSLSSNNEMAMFKRKKFISKVLQYTSDMPNKKISRQINQTALKLVNSENDLDSFIVKYADRTSQETIQRLVIRSIETIEHVIPKSPIEGEKGTNAMKNLILECARCNNDRSSTPIHEWLNTYPEMAKNMQKYFDAIIEKINSGELVGYIEYVPQVVKTIEEESHGKIKINISKLIVQDCTNEIIPLH